MKTGDKVRISPDVTHLKDWVDGTVIEVEMNRFNGTVVTARTDDGAVFFGPEIFFELKN